MRISDWSSDVCSSDLPTLRPAATALVALGYVFYAIGAALVLRRYLRQPGWRLAEDWENPNCILHGAMSITGLAAVMSGAVPFAICYATRSEEHTSELQSLMRISYAVFCLKKKKNQTSTN